MDQLDHRHAREVARLPAEIRPRGRGVDDQARQVAEGDEVMRALDDKPTNGIIDVLSRGR
jgi:hypothetical protein